MRVICLTGYPLSGKSTVFDILKADKVPGFSSGEFVRGKGITDEDIREFKREDLSLRFDDDVIDRAIAQYHNAYDEHCSIFVYDGFPRSLRQVRRLWEASSGSDDMRIYYLYSNPMDIYARTLIRDGRKDTDMSVVIGRIKAAAERKEMYMDECAKYDWFFMTVCTDGMDFKRFTQDLWEGL